MAHSKRREADRLVDFLIARGWKVRRGKHWVCRPPGGGSSIVFSFSPSSPSWLHQTRIMLRRHGLDFHG